MSNSQFWNFGTHLPTRPGRVCDVLRMSKPFHPSTAKPIRTRPCRQPARTGSRSSSSSIHPRRPHACWQNANHFKEARMGLCGLSTLADKPLEQEVYFAAASDAVSRPSNRSAQASIDGADRFSVAINGCHVAKPASAGEWDYPAPKCSNTVVPMTKPRPAFPDSGE